MAEVFIGFGSNLGDRQENISRTLGMLKDQPGLEIKKVSSLYETEPVEMESSNLFLNGVAEIRTSLVPQRLLSLLEEVEQRLGRPRESKGKVTDRKIDLDILFYNDLIFSISELTVPHPFIHRRKFILLPMLEIAPEFEHPYLRIPLKKLLTDLETEEKVTLCPHLTISL